MTTSREVQSAVFEGTQFGAGYDERAVDDLLDAVATTLTAPHWLAEAGRSDRFHRPLT